MTEFYQINEKLNYIKDLGWEDLTLYEKSAITESIVDIALLSKNFHRSVRERGVIDKDNNKDYYEGLSRPQRDRDEISSMIIIKMTLQSFENSPWLCLNQIIHYFKSKGGKFSSLSRDTFERRVSSLCETGELEKVSVKDLSDEELEKIAHNKTFRFVYKISSEVNKIHENGEYTVAKAAPLDKFLNAIIDIIQLLPDDAKNTIIKNIK